MKAVVLRLEFIRISHGFSAVYEFQFKKYDQRAFNSSYNERPVFFVNQQEKMSCLSTEYLFAQSLKRVAHFSSPVDGIKVTSKIRFKIKQKTKKTKQSATHWGYKNVLFLSPSHFLILSLIEEEINNLPVPPATNY